MPDIENLILARQKVVCILGMHRSGTSMTTRILNLMGVFLGESEKMVPPNKNDNEEGFWEHAEIVNIHEAILKELNSSWESTVPLPDKWWELPNIKKYKSELIQVIKEEFINCSIWGFKDPRTCIMLPLWEQIFKGLNIEPLFVIPIRNPIDIANSLIKRDGCSLNQGIRLWYYYMINIIDGTQGYKRIFIPYDDMIENIDLNLIKLIDFLSISVSEEDKNRIKGSLKPNLRHSKTNENKLQLLASKQVVELYNICTKFIDNPYSEINLNVHTNEMYKAYSDLMGVKYADKRIEVFVTSLFMDYGMGYSEENSIKQRIAMNEKDEFKIHFELGNAGKNIKNIRWDPLEGWFCKCVIEDILVNNKSVQIEDLNADYSKGNKFDFLTTDPIYIWENNCEIVENISICGKIIFYGPYELQRFLELEKVKVINVNEKLNYYENENNILIKDKDWLSNENNLLIKDRERIIFENENNRLTTENVIQELENKYKILLDNKMKTDEEIQLILNSPSWRITKPLRSIKRVFLMPINKKKEKLGEINFLGVGAQKSGTTTLYHILKQHPDIFMAEPKELHFFDDSNNYSKGIDWYKDTYFKDTGEAKAIGEITPAYMFMEHIPKNILKDLGSNIKFIFMLRNPVDRAYSNYKMEWGRDNEKETFIKAIELENERIVQSEAMKKTYSYIERGFYSRQIRNYLEYFPKENMIFVIFEEFINEPAKVSKEIFDFLGVQREIEIDYNIRANESCEALPMDCQLRNKLWDLYKDDVKELEKIIEKNLDIWR